MDIVNSSIHSGTGFSQCSVPQYGVQSVQRAACMYRSVDL